MATNIGVEQGDAKNANITPIKNGYQNNPVELFCGIFLIMVGVGKSINPTSCNPNVIKIEPKIIITIGDAKLPKTCPLTAQNKPNKPITVDKPSEKDMSFIAISLFDLFAEPQM